MTSEQEVLNNYSNNVLELYDEVFITIVILYIVSPDSNSSTSWMESVMLFDRKV